MPDIFEQIVRNIESLPVEFQFDLYAHLRDLFEPTFDELDEESSVAEKWDREIMQRIAAIRGGKVELLSGQEFEARTADLFAKLGIDRKERRITDK